MALQQHPRFANQARAEAALSIEVIELAKKFDLTTSEVCAVLNSVQGRWIGNNLRAEREKDATDL